METEIKIFISYLHNTKRMSGNTVVSYERDLRKMMQYFQEAHQITRVQDITETSLNSYMLYLEKNHFAASTVSRSVASMRAFFQYLYQEHLIENNPADHLHPPKVEKKDATDFVCGGSGSASSSAVGQDAERIAGSGNAGTVVCHRNPGQ